MGDTFGAEPGGTVTSGWLSPAAACLLRECVQNAARSTLRAFIILKHLLLKKALSAIDGSAAAGECAHPGAISPVPAWRALNTFDGRLLPSLSASLRWVRAAAAESARRMACA